MPRGTIKSSYPTGAQIVVKVDSVNLENKKLVLSMQLEARADVSTFSNVDTNKWITGTVTSVSNFGLFVRPAGSDVIGLVHQSRIPRDLIAALKIIAPIPAGTNKTDVEALFNAGDVVKMRVGNVNAAERKLELSMVPFRAADDDEDDFATANEAAMSSSAGDRDEEQSGGEGDNRKGGKKDFKKKDDGVIDAVDEIDDVSYNALDTLLWWRGAAFVAPKSDSLIVKDEELEVLDESKAVMEGTWRRMFELDMREDEADFSSKAFEQELKELDEEIGELKGLDDDLFDSIGAGSIFSNRVGNFVNMASLPADWQKELEFFKEAETAEKSKGSMLRSGKKGEVTQFESLVREVESEIERNVRVSMKPAADLVAMSVVDAPVQPEVASASAEV